MNILLEHEVVALLLSLDLQKSSAYSGGTSTSPDLSTKLGTQPTSAKKSLQRQSVFLKEHYTYLLLKISLHLSVPAADKVVLSPIQPHTDPWHTGHFQVGIFADQENPDKMTTAISCVQKKNTSHLQ